MNYGNQDLKCAAHTHFMHVKPELHKYFTLKMKGSKSLMACRFSLSICHKYYMFIPWLKLICTNLRKASWSTCHDCVSCNFRSAKFVTSHLALPTCILTQHCNFKVSHLRVCKCTNNVQFATAVFLCFKTFCQTSSQNWLFVFHFTATMFNFNGPKVKTRNWTEAWLK